MSRQLRISVQSPASEAAIAAVDEGLSEYNVAVGPLSDVRPLHVIAADESGNVGGGAIGRTWGLCCELQQLWVADVQRGKGLGTELMRSFEAEAKRRGCQLVYLDTFTFQAPALYGALGYTEVLRTEGFANGVAKHTMQKKLDASPR
ncbi:MAG: GNAT family N-acetyltransferase [Proteobacteria bacterium]|nr:GNAT family N-acetyltransferase [Pseudomonadota bacterium]